MTIAARISGGQIVDRLGKPLLAAALVQAGFRRKIGGDQFRRGVFEG